ncbi:hypothetical protein, partial [Faecalibaculum rodentium]|uniref:hypothetical protein n=1 Tax=Faecalibaculum rodentium TaxID=1702221 RepID=UPI002570AFAC
RTHGSTRGTGLLGPLYSIKETKENDRQTEGSGESQGKRRKKSRSMGAHRQRDSGCPAMGVLPSML